MTKNQIDPVSTSIVENNAVAAVTVTELHVRNILSDIGLSDSLNEATFIELRLRLIEFYAVTYAEFEQSYKIGRTDLAENVGVIRNAIRHLLTRFAEENPLVAALRAAELGLLARDGVNESRLRLPLALSDIVPALESIEAVVNYLSEAQDRFDKLAPSEKIRWRFQGTTKLDRYAHEELYPYLRNRQDDKPEHYAIRMIDDIYAWLYNKKFGVTTVKQGRPDSEYGLQYTGPAIRFACSVINRLGLRRVFDVDEPAKSASGSETERPPQRKAEDVRLANKIGQLWTNDKRRDKLKPRRGWPEHTYTS